MVAQRRQREEREKTILLGVVELHLLTGKPIGSNALRENGFCQVSSATIRNYFARLEKQGFLKQQHTSGGRIPTPLAYKFYATYHFNATDVDPIELETVKTELNQDTKEIAKYLEYASELLSRLSQGAIFLSSPRFDQDLITEIKLLGVDQKRYLCVLITDFGFVHTEILYASKKLSRFALKRIEEYFHFRMTGLDRPKLSCQEEETASHFYHEILLRHIVNYSNFSAEDVYKTGFSKLLQFSEFLDAGVLATGLSLFENTAYMRRLLQESTNSGQLRFWIGDDLDQGTPHTSMIAIPYFIYGKPVGAIALLGPTRMPYPKMFGLMRAFSATLSEMLTRNLYKHQITYRKPQTQEIDFQSDTPVSLKQVQHMLLEDKS